MSADDITRYITSTFENVTCTENYGYRFFMYGQDMKRPFVSLADSDSEYETVSDLNREGVYRINIGIRPSHFRKLFPDDDATWDYTALNTFMPHHEYAAFSFLCILSPDGENLERTKAFIKEAYLLAQERNAEA